MKIPELKAFDGASSSMELENLIWDMETYFMAIKVPESKKVTLMTIYLSSDAKLWWWTHVQDAFCSCHTTIKTWDALKRELKEQFLPNNSSWMAKDTLGRLKYEGTMREYVKQFSSLIIDVVDMAETDSCTHS